MLRQKVNVETKAVARIFVDEALACGRQEQVDLEGMLVALGISEEHLQALSTHEFARIWLELS
jgi:hypothetical protein